MDFEFEYDSFSRFAKPCFERYLAGYSGMHDIHFLEIGSYEGRSSVWMLQNVLSHPTSTLTSVDNCLGITFQRKNNMDVSETIKRRFNHNTRLTGRSNQVIRIVESSQSALKTLPQNHYDFIYIDGSHDYEDVLIDSALSIPLLKKGGLIAWDDYGNKHLGVAKAFDKFILGREDIQVFEKDFHVWAIKT